MKTTNLRELLKAGVYFGHRTSRWSPKMEEYIFASRDGIHIIDLQKTVEKLKEAQDYVKDLASKGGTILFIGTKRQAKDLIKKEAKECQMPYVTERWLGGTFTNFSEIKKQIKKLLDLREKERKGDLEKYTKKERLGIRDEMERLERNVGGLVELNKLPDAVLILDLNNEKIAFKEAIRKNIPVVATVDTNVDPSQVLKPIPANDDGLKSIELIILKLSEAIQEGLKAKKENKIKENKGQPRKETKK